MTEVVEGTVVDGRYRIRGRIGSGGMADVYLADDEHLGREVAIKVLHRRFARDQQFVERFKREARAAAGLAHPHVVNVFDRGEHDGTYYIAMENLPGRTLRDLLRAEAPLDQERAIDLAVQILQAAGFAHRHGVVHRDFKPHNVIVGPDDRLKVTDFGIARAGASEMTETGSIMGTAQYLSPEQAQGQHVDAPSDIYSIGVMLYEMLTGAVPFTGESAVTIALKHVGDAPPPMRGYRPDLHPALEAVVMRALAKDPAARWASADEFAAALESARAAIRSGDDGQDTADWGAVPVLPPSPDGADGRRRRWPWVVLLLALLLGGAALAFLLTRPDRVEVPAVVGKPATEAVTELTHAGLKPDLKQVRSDATPGTVVSQDPKGGEEVERTTTVVLRVSVGPGKRLVPDVEGKSQADAVKALTRAGFKFTLDDESSARFPKGVATRTDPEGGTEADAGSRVRLFISSGPERVTVPRVVGLGKAEARAELSDAGLRAVVNEVESDAPKGRVTAQDPGAGIEVDKGSRVAIEVSKGRPEVPVPNVEGRSPEDARSILEDLGFEVRERERPGRPEDEGIVVDQSPSGGRRPKGSTVTIYVGVPEEGTTPPEEGAVTPPGT